jgi:uncharacterized short protein YbdD (DUF466 family)
MSLVLAAVTYFLANTAPVASIIGLTEGGNPFALWHKVFLWSFPNYVIGAGLTAIASAFTTVSGLATMAALMVVLFAVYQSYKTYVSQAQQTQPKAMTMAMSAGR